MLEALRLLFGAAERRVGVLGGHAKAQAVYMAILAFFAMATLVFLMALATVALSQRFGPIAALAVMAGGTTLCCLAVAILLRAEQRAHARAMARQRAAEAQAMQAAALTALPLLKRGGAMGVAAGVAGLAAFAFGGRKRPRGKRDDA